MCDYFLLDFLSQPCLMILQVDLVSAEDLEVLAQRIKVNFLVR